MADTTVRTGTELIPSSAAATLTVNGRDYTLEFDPRASLLDVFRERLDLTGTKKGCDHGQCGAYTVLINGRRVNSCLTLAVMHEGDEITTIEGLGSPGPLHRLQAAFVQCDGFQCGYCTAGQICSAIGMLGEVRAGEPSHVTADIAAQEIVKNQQPRRSRADNSRDSADERRTADRSRADRRDRRTRLA
jgi:xanthine dehydrogenase YagT iron-sulfur-binding subunit